MTLDLKASKANSWWARRLNANPHLPLKRRWSCLTLIITGLLFCSAVVAQVSISTASLPLTISLPPLNASSPAFDLLITSPSTSTITSLYLTLSICSLGTNTSIIPAALVSTDVSDFDINDNSVSDRLSGGVERANRKAKGRDVWALSWDKGFANWTYVDDTGVGEIGMRIGFADGQEVSDGNVVIQLGAGVDESQQAVDSSMLYLGDSTSSQSLLFSSLLFSSPQPQSSYPNYTLSAAELPIPSLPEFSLPTFELLVIPTGSSPTANGLDYSHCAIRNANVSTGALGRGNPVINATTEWMAVGDEEGYRTYWVIGGLESSSNYTAWILDTSTQTMSQPIWFTTKQSSFSCQLVLPTPYCPSIGYAAPLTANSTVSGAPISFLPDSITTPLSQSLESFATTLSSKACGRDFYSHVSSCQDCYSSYRDWICRTLIPRCTDPSTGSEDEQLDIIAPSVISRKTSSGSVYEYDYEELLPCLGICNRVDRTCPAWIAFTCPYRGINANETYGYFGQDESRGDGSRAPGGGGVRSSDKWGNRWCNGP